MLALMPGTTIERDQREELPERPITGIAPRAGATDNSVRRREQPLRCVWTGYPSNGWSCHSRIPKHVVTDAWREELEGGEQADRFFHFVWHGGVWLAYGLKDGRVRGACCPTHGTERRRTPPETHAHEYVLAPAA